MPYTQEQIDALNVTSPVQSSTVDGHTRSRYSLRDILEAQREMRKVNADESAAAGTTIPFRINQIVSGGTV